MSALFYTQLGETTGDKTYFAKAINLAEPQIELTPSGLALRYAYARALMGEGRAEEAKKQLEICVEQDTNFKYAQELLKMIVETSTVTPS